MLSTGKDPITLIPHIKEVLIEKGLTLSTAESCTGGNIARCLTLVPGISKVFKGGVVAYCNDAKIHILGVRESVIRNHTEVSRECSIEMAEGANFVLGSDIAISTTGYAEPSHSDEDCPIRQQAYITVCYNKNGVKKRIERYTTFLYEKTRERFINHLTHEALCLLAELLEEV